jgi:hypothetical protein
LFTPLALAPCTFDPNNPTLGPAEQEYIMSTTKIELRSSNRDGCTWTANGVTWRQSPAGDTLGWPDDAIATCKGGNSGSNTREGYIAGHGESLFWAEGFVMRDEAEVQAMIAAQQARAATAPLWAALQSHERAIRQAVATSRIGSPDHPGRALGQTIQVCIEEGIALPDTLEDAARLACDPRMFKRKSYRSGGFAWEVYPDHQASLAEILLPAEEVASLSATAEAAYERVWGPSLAEGWDQSMEGLVAALASVPADFDTRRRQLVAHYLGREGTRRYRHENPDGLAGRVFDAQVRAELLACPETAPFVA